jgi:uncharacterized protein (DUF58 family)
VGFLGRVCRKRSVAFVISDFMLPDGREVVDRQMRSTARKHELINILVSDPGDFVLPSGGLITVRDLESGRLVRLDAFRAKTRKAFEARQAGAYDKIREAFRAANLDCIEISTATAAADALTRYFRYRERKKTR